MNCDGISHKVYQCQKCKSLCEKVAVVKVHGFVRRFCTYCQCEVLIDVTIDLNHLKNENEISEGAV